MMPNLSTLDPQHWVADVTTRSGALLHIRSATLDDGKAVADLFRHVDPDHLRHRFLEPMSEVSDDQTAALIGKQDPRSTTFLAFGGNGEMAACATLYDDPTGQTAEWRSQLGKAGTRGA